MTFLNGSSSPRRPRRILHAFNQHRGGGGADNAARATIEATRRLGIEVEVYTRSSEDLPKNLLGRIEAGVSAVYAPRSVRVFREILARFRPEIVHIHEVFPLVSPWILPECARAGVPVVMTCVDYRLTCPIVTHLHQGEICTKCTGGHEYWALLRNCRENVPESVTVTLYNMMVRGLGLFERNVARFIAPSEFTRHWLIEHGGLAPAKVVTVCPLVEVAPTPADPGKGTYAAFAGRFTPEKGVDTFLAAAELSGIPCKMSRSAEARVTLPIHPNVEVVVTHNRDELNAFYRNARMLVFPSIWFETFGLVGAESMGHGIPVVASRLGALECLVDDEVDGLHFHPGNAADLAGKMARLWNDPGLCRKLGAAAREKAKKQWQEDSHTRELLGLYAGLLP